LDLHQPMKSLSITTKVWQFDTSWWWCVLDTTLQILQIWVMRVVVLNATFNNISIISWRCLVNGTEKLCIILKFKKFPKKKYFLILVHNFWMFHHVSFFISSNFCYLIRFNVTLKKVKLANTVQLKMLRILFYFFGGPELDVGFILC
jgi:hypothetical protein